MTKSFLAFPSAACLMQRQCKRAERELALYFPSVAYLIQRQCKVSAMENGNHVVSSFYALPNRSLSYTKIVQTSGKRACSLFPECSLSYTKIVQGECNRKWKSRSVFILCIAEPKLILYKDSANSPTYKTKPSVFDHPLIMCSYVCRLAVKPTIGNSLQRLGFSLCRFRDIILRE